VRGILQSIQSVLQPKGANVPEEIPQNGLTDNSAGGLAYITFIPAIIFLVTAPYNQKSFIRFHAWQSIFLFIASVVIHTVLLFIPIIGWILSLPVSLAILAIWVICLIKAFNGQRFKLPVIGNLAEQQAGA
jgi:uncharacterized membrane protein